MTDPILVVVAVGLGSKGELSLEKLSDSLEDAGFTVKLSDDGKDLPDPWGITQYSLVAECKDEVEAQRVRTHAALLGYIKHPGAETI